MQREALRPVPYAVTPYRARSLSALGCSGPRHGYGGHMGHSSSPDHVEPTHAGLPHPVVDIVFPGSDTVGAEIGQCRVG